MGLPVKVYRHPNLFVIGAPKCGTTSLYAYLRQHSQIFLSDPKEPNHFAYSYNNPYGWSKSKAYANLDAYLSLFQANTTAPIVGEASTCYSLMPHVAKAIRHYNPDAKILAVLREPVQRAWSMYLFWQQFSPSCSFIDTQDFRNRFIADDLMTDEERQQPLRVKWLRGAGMYWDNLQHFYREFPAEQIHLLKYEEFVRQPQASLDGVCQFLGIEQKQFTIGVRENRTAVPKFRRLYNFINLDVRHPLRVMAKRILGRILPLSGLKTLANSTLLSLEATRSLPESLIKELSSYYRDDLQQLMDSTGFDTRDWLQRH